MTPYEIGILLHYYVSPYDPVDKYDMAAPLWRQTINRFVDDEMLKKDIQECSGRSWMLTDKGNCYVAEGICKVPLPKPKWFIPMVAGTA